MSQLARQLLDEAVQEEREEFRDLMGILGEDELAPQLKCIHCKVPWDYRRTNQGACEKRAAGHQFQTIYQDDWEGIDY